MSLLPLPDSNAINWSWTAWAALATSECCAISWAATTWTCRPSRPPPSQESRFTIHVCPQVPRISSHGGVRQVSTSSDCRVQVNYGHLTKKNISTSLPLPHSLPLFWSSCFIFINLTCNDHNCKADLLTLLLNNLVYMKMTSKICAHSCICSIFS